MNEFSSFKDFCCKYSFDNCRIAVQDILSQNYPFPFLSAILPDLSSFSFIFRNWRWSFKNTSCLKILSSRTALSNLDSKCPPRKYVFCSLSDTFPQTLVRFEDNIFSLNFLRKVVNIWIFQQFLHCRFLILVDHLHLRNGDLPFHDHNQHDHHNHDKHDNRRYIIKIWQ